MKLDLVNSNDLDLLNQSHNFSHFNSTDQSFITTNISDIPIDKRLKTMYQQQQQQKIDNYEQVNEIKMNGQIDYQQSPDYSSKYNQSMMYTNQINHQQYQQQQQQQYNFNQQYQNFYPSQYDYSFNQIQSQPIIQQQQQQQQVQPNSITPPPSNTNTPTPLYSNTYHQMVVDKKINKNYKRCGNLTNLLSKKEIGEDYEKDDEDEDDEDLSEDEDDDDDDFDFKNKKHKDLDLENDYEIKHNCLTEQGAYMNTLFNSPSSMSSQSGKNKKNMKKQDSLVVTKVETNDELTTYQDDSQQQHMNNMINSYSLAGIMNDYDLVNLPLRELNKRLRFLPKQMAYNMKKRRRTLKNRKYAQNCRSKRLEQKSEMEIQNSQLKIELQRMNKLMEKIQHENSLLKSYLNSNKTLDDLIDKNQMISTIGESTPLTPTTPTNCNQLTHLLSLPPVHYNGLNSHQVNNFNNNQLK